MKRSVLTIILLLIVLITGLAKAEVAKKQGQGTPALDYRNSLVFDEATKKRFAEHPELEAQFMGIFATAFGVVASFQPESDNLFNWQGQRLSIAFFTI